MRLARRRQALPLLRVRGSGGDGKGSCLSAKRHNRLHHGIVADDTQIAHRNSQLSGDESQRPQRRLAGQYHGCPGHAANGAHDGERIADSTPLLGCKERYVGSHIEFGACPDCLARRLDVRHAAVRMPADIDRVDFRGAHIAGLSRFNAAFAQRLTDPPTSQHQHAFDAVSNHVIGRDARGREHLFVIDGKPHAAQASRVFRRRVGAPVGEHREGKLALLKRQQGFGGARKQVVGTQ